MVSPEQAADIRQYLINQLAENGFGDVITETVTRLDASDPLDYRENPTYALNTFIEQIKAVFSSQSNSNFGAILDRLNNSLEPGNHVEGIVVQPENDNEPAIDLRNLPDYSEIVAGLAEIQALIISEQ